MESKFKLDHGEEVREEQDQQFQKFSFSIKDNNQNSVIIPSGQVIQLQSSFDTALSYDETNHILTATQIPKPNKNVSGPEYVIKADDYKKWLVFQDNCNVIVPTGLVADRVYEGESATGATVTFVEDQNVTIRHVASVSKIMSGESPFGLRNYLLYGTDPVNYLE